MFNVKCSLCQKEYEVDENYEGKKVKCSSCNETFVVPSSISETPDIEEKVVEDNVPSDEYTTEESNIKPHKMSYILIGNPILLVFLVITIIAFFVYMAIGVLFLMLTLVSYFWFSVKYKKEEYFTSLNSQKQLNQ